MSEDVPERRGWRFLEWVLFGTRPDPENCNCKCHPLPFIFRCYRCLACGREEEV